MEGGSHFIIPLIAISTNDIEVPNPMSSYVFIYFNHQLLQYNANTLSEYFILYYQDPNCNDGSTLPRRG